jgi:CHASE2 domain-containing sensor protein
MKTTLLALLFVVSLPVHAEPQSNTPSQASAISLAPSVELTAMSLKAVPAGSRLIVKTLRPFGDLIEIVAISAVTGVSVTLHVTADALKLTGLVAGGALLVTVVSAGYLLMSGSEALAFIPNEICHSHIHHRKLSQ